MSTVEDDIARVRAAAPTTADLQIAAPIKLPDELLPVEPFPMDALPDAFKHFVADVADRMNCPPDFVAVPLLVASASLVARHVGIRPQARTDWIERGNLWALIVGRPGVMKSPAMMQALAPLERLEAQAARDFGKSHEAFLAGAVIRELREEAGKKNARAALKKDAQADVSELLAVGDEVEMPIRNRYIVADATYEKLGELFVENPGGLLSVRDEMRGLFLYLGREESATARAFYITSWSGGSYHFDRIGRGTVTIEDARLSMVGGIQPGPLGDLMRRARRGASDDGMMERFLIAWPDSAGEWRNVDRWPDTEAKQKLWTTFEYLDNLDAAAVGAVRENGFDGLPKGLPFLRFDDAALAAFTEWRGDLERKVREADVESLEGALSKFKHHVPALALALHVIDGGIGPIAFGATTRALVLADYFESHTRRLNDSSRRDSIRAARFILDKVNSGALPEQFTARDVYRPKWAGLSDKFVVDEALDLLVAHRWLFEAAVQTGGRPTMLYGLTEAVRRG